MAAHHDARTRLRTAAHAFVATGLLAAGLTVAAVIVTSAGTQTMTFPGIPGAAAGEASSAAPSETVTSSVSAPVLPTPIASDGLMVTLAVQTAPNGAVAAIPSTALVAYQRAAAVMHGADPSCGLQWPILAGIGAVISQHGEVAGHHLSARGVVEPALYGAVVRDSAGNKIADTDAGRLDHDTTGDRAVGPMSLPPASWSVAGVDADGDGRRDPQDINDASLAVAVLLCASNSDLSNQDGASAALRHLSDSPTFIAAVLHAASAYAAGEGVPQPPPSATAIAAGQVSAAPTGQPQSPAPATATVTATATATLVVLHQTKDNLGEEVRWETDQPVTSPHGTLPSFGTTKPSKPSAAPTACDTATVKATATPAPSSSTTTHTTPVPGAPSDGDIHAAETGSPQTPSPSATSTAGASPRTSCQPSAR